MKKHLTKALFAAVAIVMVLSAAPVSLFTLETSAYTAGDIYGTTGGGMTADDPVVVSNFTELNAALRSAEILYIKAVTPDSLSSVYVNSETISGNATAVTGTKHLTLASTWDFTNNGTCDHLIAISGATLEIDGAGTIRYNHNKKEGSGAVIKVNYGANLKILSNDVTIEGYGNSELYDDWGNYTEEFENYARAIYVDRGTVELNGGVYKGVHYGFSTEKIYASAVYMGNKATATINGGMYSTSKHTQTIGVSTGGIHIVNSPNVKIKSGMFDGIKIDSEDGTDSIYNHLSRGTRMINKQNNTVFNTHTKMTLEDTEAVNFLPYQFNYFRLNDNVTTGNGTTYSGNGSFVSKINEGVNFSFNATPLSDEMRAKGITAYKSYSIKDSSEGDTAVAGETEYNSDNYLSGNYIFKKAGRVTLNCYHNFYYNGQHLFSWMSEAVFNVQEGSEIARVDMTVDRIKSNYSVPKPVVTTAENFIYAHYWYKLDDAGQVTSGSLNSFGELVAGEKYRLEVRMYPMAGYSFSSSLVVGINGRTATLDEVTASGVAIFYIDIPVPEYEITIEGAVGPIEGMLTGEYHGFTSMTYDFVAGSRSHYWCTADGQKFEGAFVAGETYYKIWEFTWASEEQKLPDADNITVTIDGGYVPDEDIYVNDINSYIEIRKEYVCVGNGSYEDPSDEESSEDASSEDISSEESSEDASSEDESSDDESSEDIADILYGDVNADGEINSLDAAQVLKYDARLITLKGDALIAGDVDGDGDVNSLDAAQILKYDAFIIDIFPIENIG